MEKINIAELLRDCPKGMELDCTMFENVTFVRVDMGRIQFPIEIAVGGIRSKYLTKEGCFHDTTLLPESKCVIFPKGKTTWEGFQRPFKDGDILVGKSNQPFIFKKLNNGNGCYSYCGIDRNGGFGLASTDWTFADSLRFASEEEKQKLFDAIKANGYVWHSNIKCLEKVRIDPGDVAVSGAGNIVLVSEIDEDDVVHFLCRLCPHDTFEIKEDIGIGTIKNCRLANDRQKQKLFDCLISRGYKYNSETNTLEKLSEPKFKVGDKIKSKINQVIYTITDIRSDVYIACVDMDKFGYHIPFSMEKNYELIPNKFDINTLKPFDKVLTRVTTGDVWGNDFFGYYKDRWFHCSGHIATHYCIPFEGNEHLLGTTDDCDDFYKTWE